MQSKDVTAYGADYSAREFHPNEMDGYPGVRIDFLFRYIGYPGNPKCISFYPGAYRTHVEAGRPVGLYHQIGYGDFTGGESAGREHAQTALRDARSWTVGWDGESPLVACFDRRMAAFTRNGVYYAPISLQTVRDYMRGFKSVAGSVTGFYGFEDTMGPAIDEGWADFTMQCGARSAHIPGITGWQENNYQPSLLGIGTDRLELYKRLDEVFGNGDDMGNWDTPITLTADEIRASGDPEYKGEDITFPPGVYLKYGNLYSGLTLTETREMKAMLEQSAAREVAMLAAVGAIAQNPLVTKEELRQLVNDAVKDHVKITGTVEISSVLPPVSQE